MTCLGSQSQGLPAALHVYNTDDKKKMKMVEKTYTLIHPCLPYVYLYNNAHVAGNYSDIQTIQTVIAIHGCSTRKKERKKEIMRVSQCPSARVLSSPHSNCSVACTRVQPAVLPHCKTPDITCVSQESLQMCTIHARPH